MDQLLHCLLVYSGNDAAAAIAEHVGGSTDGFVEMMNSYARELGCTGTHFTNPHGLQEMCIRDRYFHSSFAGNSGNCHSPF